MANWAVDEFGEAKLGDGRLNARLIKLATRFAEQPTASISGACGDWAETLAAYRFFDQASAGKRGLSWQSILQPHIDCSEGRMTAPQVAAAIENAQFVATEFKVLNDAKIQPAAFAVFMLRQLAKTESARSYCVDYRCCPLLQPNKADHFIARAVEAGSLIAG